MLPFEGGQMWTVAAVLAQVRAAAERDGIEGITLLGGEPLAHAAGAAALARATQRLGLSVMVFSGFTLVEANALPDPAVRDLLVHTDILVDGPYRRELPEKRRRWIGSANQQIHFLSNRYRADDPCWLLPNTLEIRLTQGELTVNGFPAASAVGLWKSVGFAARFGRVRSPEASGETTTTNGRIPTSQTPSRLPAASPDRTRSS
jgi:anaerobic ribonucleoside-triphosphate reductase activating protein